MSSAGVVDVLEFWFVELEPRQWWVKEERLDRGIEQRFGRYPHRNTVLDRESTPEELQYLKQPGSSF